MKKFLFVVLSFLLFASCDSDYKYITDSYKLVAYTDKSAITGHFGGTFAFGFGGMSGSINEEVQYRILVLDEINNEVYPIILKSKNTTFKFIDSTSQPKMTVNYRVCRCNDYKGYDLRYIQRNEPSLNYTLYIPKNSITYSNSFDGL